MPHMTHAAIEGQEAFCATCPAPEEVTDVLREMGFQLTFHMPAVTPRRYKQVAPLPTQFHYRDRWGNEIIFLHGRDAIPTACGCPTTLLASGPIPAATLEPISGPHLFLRLAGGFDGSASCRPDRTSPEEAGQAPDYSNRAIQQG